MLASSAAPCRHRREQGVDGPLFLGRDTHALPDEAGARMEPLSVGIWACRKAGVKLVGECHKLVTDLCVRCR